MANLVIQDSNSSLKNVPALQPKVIPAQQPKVMPQEKPIVKDNKVVSETPLCFIPLCNPLHGDKFRSQ